MTKQLRENVESLRQAASARPQFLWTRQANQFRRIPTESEQVFVCFSVSCLPEQLPTQ